MIGGWNPRVVAVGVAALLLLGGCAKTVGGSAEPGGAGDSPTVVDSTTRVSSDGGSDTTAPTHVSGSETQPTGTDTSGTETSGTETVGSTAATAPSRPAWKLPNLKPNRPKTQYGDIKAEPGQAYGVSFTGRDGKPQGELVYVVSKLTLDPSCATTVKPVNSHFLQIDITLEPRNVGSDAAKDWTGTFGGSAWTAYDAAGTVEPGTDTDQARRCAGSRALPLVTSDVLLRGGLIRGSVVLDVKRQKGTVVLDVGVGGGWEFRYG